MTDWKKEWVENHPCEMYSNVPYPQTSLTALLDRAEKKFPDGRACTLYGAATTYRELNDQARRLASALREFGARKGRYVALLLPNIPEYLAALQAVWMTGATALQLSPLMVAEEAIHWLKVTDCSIVVTFDLLAPTVMGGLEDGPLDHVVLTTLAHRMNIFKGMLYRFVRKRRNGSFSLPDDEHRHPYNDLLHYEPLAQPAAIDPHEDVAVLAPTGGTTASPKAVQLTHANLMANAMQLRDYKEGEDGVGGVLAVLPLFHSYGLTGSVLANWARASTIHLHPRFEPRSVLKVLAEQKPEMVLAVPAMLHALNVIMRRRPVDLSFVQAVISGASALTPSIREEFMSHGVQEVVEGYGLTEASPVTHANPRGEGNRPGTIGLPLVDTQARIVDPESGKDLPDGEVGELAVRGPQVMKGYLNNPDATAEVLRDGWLFTGDMARRDRDGYYTIVDRKRDIIKTSGFLVYPAEVEEILRSAPGVGEVAVVGVLDEERGEVLKAMVVPGPIPNGLSVESLHAYCREHLGKHKRPRDIEIVKELPKNFLGKVLRRKLREQPVMAS
jgi:long-chain acyl-CoA synthetase